jgi:hypothetical protein
MDDPVNPLSLNLPASHAVYGWLGLDRRGNWLLKGERISNPRISDYLARNYACDGNGHWYVENGIQQVFVALEYTPFVLRVADSSADPLNLVTHDGRPVVAIRSAWLDEAGSLILNTDAGVGVVDDRDLDRLLACFKTANQAAPDEEALGAAIARAQRGEDPRLVFCHGENAAPIKSIAASAVPAQFGFVQRPSPA